MRTPVPGHDSLMQLDRAARELLLDGRRVRLAEKPFRVLVALVDAGGEVVTRETLRERLWPDDTFVDFDNNLNTAVASLRQALGDSARAPRYVETLPRVGYRLIVPRRNGAGVPDGPLPGAAASRYSIGLLALAAALLITVVNAGFALWPVSPRDEPGQRPASQNQQASTFFARGQYLRGQYMSAHDRPELLAEARQAFRAAAAADPTFAAALAEEADTVVDLSFAGAVGLPDGLSEARALARRALTIDRNTAAAHRVLGMAQMLLDWDLDTADRHLDAAERLEPDEARTAMARATHASILGRHAAAVEAAERAVALEPESWFVRADLAFFYLAAGRNDDAATSSRAVLEVQPDFLPALTYAVTANERLGRWTEAASAARAVMAAQGATADDLGAVATLAPRDAVRSWRLWDLDRVRMLARDRPEEFSMELALKHAAVGDRSLALDYLERAHARRNAMLVFVRAFPELEGLRGDPRFERIARSVAGSS